MLPRYTAKLASGRSERHQQRIVVFENLPNKIIKYYTMVQLTNTLKEHDVEDKWLQIQRSFLREYRELYPSDLQYGKGEFRDMLKRIGTKLGMSEYQLRKIIMRWEESASHYY